MSASNPRNHFHAFGLESKPWIDQDLLKERFLQLSAKAHPDKAAAEHKPTAERAFADLNESYIVLRNTRSRLLHLLELRWEVNPSHNQDVPPSALHFFPDVAAATKSADGLLKRKKAANSPMLKVQLMAEGLEELEKIQDLQGRIRKRIEGIEADLKEMSIDWAGSGAAAGWKTLHQAATALGFLERWNTQLQERAAQLTF